MQATLENIRKIVTESPRSVLKRKNRVEEGGPSRSKVKKKQESTEVRA
jgi:hypothetical protein